MRMRTATSAMLLLSACAPTAHDVTPTQGEGDHELAAFDLANPECQLWTNWDKMCSRTGTNGERYCVTDALRPVSPSAPFCVYQWGDVHVPDLNSPQSGSLDRFCVRDVQQGLTTAGSTITTTVTRCAQFKEDRPFNGRSIAGRLHPWCGEWSDTATEEPVCSSDPTSDLPGCQSLAAQRYEHEHPLYCSRMSAPGWCEEPLGMMDRPTPSPEGVILYDRRYRTSDHQPVFGVLCRRRSDSTNGE